jgi:hypothetical protein
MKPLYVLALISLSLFACKKDDTEFTATIHSSATGVAVGDPNLHAVVAITTSSDTMVLLNIPNDYLAGRQIHFDIRPQQPGDPVVILTGVLRPKERWVKNLR